MSYLLSVVLVQLGLTALPSPKAQHLRLGAVSDVDDALEPPALHDDAHDGAQHHAVVADFHEHHVARGVRAHVHREGLAVCTPRPQRPQVDFISVLQASRMLANAESCLTYVPRRDTHQRVHPVQQVVDLLAVDQPDVALAQEPAHLALELVLIHVRHHHDGHQVVEHVRQQAVLLVLEPLALRLAQLVVPGEGQRRQSVEFSGDTYFNK